MTLAHTVWVKKRDTLSHAVFPTAVFRWSIQGLLPTHLWLLLLDELQNLMSEPIILGPCISENIDERTRKRNFQGNFYSSNTHFRTITTTLLRRREEKKKAISSEAEKKGVFQLWQVTGGLRSSRIEQALFTLIFCQFAMGLTTWYMRKWKRYKVMWTWKKLHLWISSIFTQNIQNTGTIICCCWIYWGDIG